MTWYMTAVPSPEDQLLEVRRGADRLLSLLLVLHLPAALGLAALHGTWLAAILVGRQRLRRRLPAGAARPGRVRDPRVHRPRPGGVRRAVRHQSHGLIEMHFHFFGALAFLLVYRDWRVIVARRRPRSRSTTSASWSLQDAGAPVWVMSHVAPEPRHGRCCTPSSSSSRRSCWSSSRARWRPRRWRPPQLRVDDAAERAQLARLAEALERRDLSVAGETGDGAAAILRSGIGHVATLVETIQSAAVDITQTSQRGLRGLRRLRALQQRDRRRRRQRRRPSPSSRRGSCSRPGEAAGEAAAAVERALHAAEAAAEAAAGRADRRRARHGAPPTTPARP